MLRRVHYGKSQTSPTDSTYSSQTRTVCGRPCSRNSRTYFPRTRHQTWHPIVLHGQKSFSGVHLQCDLIILHTVSNISAKIRWVQKNQKIHSPRAVSVHSNLTKPADVATRPVTACRLIETNWLTGLSFLQHPTSIPMKDAPYNLVDSDTDVEVRAHATTCLNPDSGLGSNHFKRFSSCKSLRVIATLFHIAQSFKNKEISYSTIYVMKLWSYYFSFGESFIKGSILIWSDINL